MMKNMTTKAVIGFITLSLLILSSCGKKDNNTRIQKKEAIMRMEVACKGDLQSQVAVLSFLATNSQRDLLNIVNDSTGVITAGPFLQNSDFLDHRLISFHSEKKLSSVSIQLAISPKVYATSQDQTFSMTIKIFFDGKLKDNQTFFYDQLYGSAFTTPKDFDYKVEVNQ